MKEVYKRVLALILSSLLPGLISSSPVLSSLFLLLRAILGLLLLHRLSLPTPRCRKRILRSGLQLVKHFSKGGGGGASPSPPGLRTEQVVEEARGLPHGIHVLAASSSSFLAMRVFRPLTC